eukprot:11274214-Ditylum_brightwellii.AAC.1
MVPLQPLLSRYIPLCLLICSSFTNLQIHAFSFSPPPPPPFITTPPNNDNVIRRQPKPVDIFRVASYQCRRQKLVDETTISTSTSSTTTTTTTTTTNTNIAYKNEPMLALKRVAEVLREASAHNIHLVVFPEMFFSFASGGIGDYTSALEVTNYEIGIVGTLCAELGIACVLPYMEKARKTTIRKDNTYAKKEDEKEDEKDDEEETDSDFDYYSAAIAYNADGTKAGNVRAILPPSPPPPKKGEKPRNALSPGHPTIDMEPMTLTIHNSETITTQDITVGIILGFNNIERPEQARHLARKGTDVLIAPSLGGKSMEKIHEGLIVANHVIPTRAMENSAFMIYAAYEGEGGG